MNKYNKSNFLLYVKYGSIVSLSVLILTLLFSNIIFLYIQNSYILIYIGIFNVTIFYIFSYIGIFYANKKNNLNADKFCWTILATLFVYGLILRVFLNLFKGETWYSNTIPIGVFELFMPLIVPLIYDKVMIKKKERKL